MEITSITPEAAQVIAESMTYLVQALQESMFYLTGCLLGGLVAAGVVKGLKN